MLSRTLRIIFCQLAVLLFFNGCKPTESAYAIIVGKDAATDGRVYLAHNTYATGEQMLNIYNKPSTDSTSRLLWFEFPGLCFSDSYLNGSGVGIAVVPSPGKHRRSESVKFHQLVNAAAGLASSAEKGASVLSESAAGAGIRVNATVLFADSAEGWLCRLTEDGQCSIVRVPDSATVYVRGNPASGQIETVRTEERHHRTDLCRHLLELVPENGITLLSNVFCFDPKHRPEKSGLVYVGFPGLAYGSQTAWTCGTTSPECCHRYATADEALEKHFTDTRHFSKRWPDHFYARYLHPEGNIDAVDHDYVVFVPKGVSDVYNDHFHVIDDPARGLLYAFWTQGSYEGADDMHIAFSRSQDGGLTWSEPGILAGSPDLVNPTRRAAWQQPMLSRSGRLYCLWNQETVVKSILCGPMWGMYSDDGGLTWSEPEESPLLLRADTDPADLSVPPTWCNWQRPVRLGEGGRFFTGSSRHGKAPYDSVNSCKVEFWQYENIDDDPEIRDIRISIFSNGRNSLSADSIKAEHNFVAGDGSAVEEASVVGLPDGRLFALMRSSVGFPVWSQSRDGGRTWDRPEILRMEDGTPVLHPRSPCPMYDVMGPEARSGRYVAFVHNSFDFDASSSYQLRGPLFRLDGVFDPESEQPVKFSLAGTFIPRESLNSMYSSYTPCEGGGILWFNDRKYYLFGKRID